MAEYINPLLSKVKLPGRIFQLPSKGLFYEGKGILSPSVTDGEVEVKSLSALAELKLRSPDLLFGGKALEQICEECIPQILKPNLLVSRDVDAIFCFLKLVTYGADTNVKSAHTCENAKVHDYLINIETVVMNANNQILNNKDSLYTHELPNGQIVHLRPVTFKDSIDMTHIRQEIDKYIDINNKVDNKMIENMVVRDVMSIIDSVEADGVKIDDKKMIEQWIRSLKKSYIDELTKSAEKSNEWGFNLSVPVMCKDCGEYYPHNLELDPINFFSG